MKRRNPLLFAIILFVVAPGVAHAQAWSGIIDPKRAIDWSQAGVTGGIPTRNTICSSLTSTATAAQIQSALNACPSGQVVSLAAGNYTLTSGLTIPSNVTLRGAGASQTVLTFTGSSSYYWGPYAIGFIGNFTGGFESSPPGPDGANPANVKSWVGTNGAVGTYTKGATVINLGSAPAGSPNLQVGNMLQLVQNDDTAPTGGLFVCSSSANGCSREGSGYTHGTGQRQNVKVVAISGNAVTISPGLYMGNWTSAKNPVAYWWGGDTQFAGVENLQVFTTLGLWGGIEIFESSDCWVSGVSVHVGSGSRAGYRPHLSRNITIQNSFLDPMTGGGFGSTTSYGIELFASTAVLLQNNITKQVDSPFLFSTGSAGNVIAYNYDFNGLTGLASHEEGFMMNLYEGNDVLFVRSDTFHGTQNLTTMFRNRVESSGQASVDAWSYNRFFNIIGNVLGTADSGSYQCIAPDPSGHCSRYASPSNIYRLGYSGASTGVEIGVALDPIVATTAMRWGNYDVVTATSRFLALEVPSGLAQYANPVPGSQNLPASFYLSAKPAWWPSAKPWPAIGPDVTGGNMSGVGGHAYTIPARDCYSSISSSIANFNAATCYASSTTSGPAPPTGLASAVQ